MNSYIEKLQSKSETKRKQILVVFLTACMSVVVLIWVYNLGNHFSNNTKSQASSELRPFKLFADSLSSVYTNISASVGNISSKSKVEPKRIDLIPVEPANQ